MTKRLVIIDDDQGCLNTYSRELTKHGWTVKSFINCQAALDYLTTARDVDCFLIDFRMPFEDGFITWEYIKQLYNTPPPAIMVTAFAFTGVTAKWFRVGGSDFISKPIDYVALSVSITRAIGERKGALNRQQHEQNRTDAMIDRTVQKRIAEWFTGAASAPLIICSECLSQLRHKIDPTDKKAVSLIEQAVDRVAEVIRNTNDFLGAGVAPDEKRKGQRVSSGKDDSSPDSSCGKDN